uniref:Baseplate J-like protein n=1 Tax=Pseudomonas phage Touem01 TaxID=3138548 RepID=A0AAU6W2Z8_9VIRU
MAFQVKDFVSITASMINWMRASTRKISDYNVGSVARTLVEAPAAEIDELYQQMFIGIKEAIPVSVYNSFSFDALPAIAAAGLVRVQMTPSSADVLVQAGTTFFAPGLLSTYSSLEDVTIKAGSSFVDILVLADSTGTAGNITEGQNFTLTPSPSTFLSASNLSGFSSGQDQETPDEQKLRFAAYIDSISRATNNALRYGLTTARLYDDAGNITERVATGITIEPYLEDPNQPIGLVECYIHNGVGNTSAALVSEASKIIEGYYDPSGVAVAGYKAAGIPTPVYAATEVLQNVTGVLTQLDGYDKPTLVNDATSAIYSYIQSLPIGSECVISEVIHIVKDLDGVYDFVPSVPVANVKVAKRQKLMPGSISIT